MKKVTKLRSNEAQKTAQRTLRVAAYCRVSTDNDAQLESLEMQKTHYEEYINSREDWTLAGVYFDRGITGTKKEKRPGLLQLVADCELGKIDFVVTKSISRLARNTTDCLEIVRSLLALNIPIYFEKENLDSRSMQSELILAILSSLAEGESESIAGNNKWSAQKRFLNGTFKLSYPPYGYDWDGNQMVINPEQAEVVRWIFAQVLSGHGTQAIADELNEKGVPTRRGGPWTSNTVRGMIGNEKYTGDVIFQKTFTDSHFNRHINNGQRDQYAMADHHEAIISREDFEKAAMLIDQHRVENNVTKGSEKYLQRYCFSGKIICGECGDTFKRRIHSSGSQNYVAWCCTTHLLDKERCSMKYIRDDDLKVAFVRMINKLVFGRRLVLKPYIAALRMENRDSALQRIRELQDLQIENAHRREMLTRLMAQGYIDQVLYNEEKSDLLAQAEQYRAEIAALEKSALGEVTQIAAAAELVRFAEKGVMLEAFDEEVFAHTVDRIVVISRKEIIFELKCGLALRERL